MMIPEPVVVFCYMARDFADVVKLRTLRWRDYPGRDYPNPSPNLIAQVVKSREPFLPVVRGRCDHGRRLREMIGCWL